MTKDEQISRAILDGDEKAFYDALRCQRRRQWSAKIAIALGLIALMAIGWLGYIAIHTTILQQGLSGLGGGQ